MSIQDPKSNWNADLRAEETGCADAESFSDGLPWKQSTRIRVVQRVIARVCIRCMCPLTKWIDGEEFDVLRKLSIALSVSADTLVFDAERDSDEELRLQLEATQRLTDQDRELVKRFINGLLLSHEAKRLAA
jgi:hypothetical protein